MKKILVTIFNYNCNDNALVLLNMFSNYFETYVLDSGSPIKNDKFISLENIYYNGLINEAIKLLKETESEYLLFITSDVIINQLEYNKLLFYVNNNLDDIGIYSPSTDSTSRAHNHCINKNTNSLRNVLFVEGFFSLVKKEVVEAIYPINLVINKLGWCTDLQLGYNCIKLGLKCIIDDTIQIHHPNGTGYNTGQAHNEMHSYIKYLADSEFESFFHKALINGNA